MHSRAAESHLSQINQRSRWHIVGQTAPRQRACLKVVPSSSNQGPRRPELAEEAQPQEQHQQLSRIITLASNLPNQADQLWDPSDRNEEKLIVLEKPSTRSIADLDYLSVSWLAGACPEIVAA